MEFINGVKISEFNQLTQLGLDTKKIATTLCEVFGEMIFCHGFVHCDPHAGNIFVRIHPDFVSSKPEPQLVLLDHGIYRELDDNFRRTYCDLWKAMLTRDSEHLEQCGMKLNVGKYAKYLPLMFTYRSIRSSSPLGSTQTEEERQKLREDLQQIHFSHVRWFVTLSLAYFEKKSFRYHR
jgi:aarF domain-containing kinase